LLPDQLIARQAEFLEEMKGEKAKQDLDFIFFAIVDTKNKMSHVVIYSDAEAELAAQAYGEVAVNNLMTLPGLISRKKQLMPVIQEALSA
jgi:manganese-dependent inorganic pyrophosphatase